MGITLRETFEVGLYAVNCTILRLGDKVYIVDPGSEATFIAAQLKKMALTPSAILLTHAHFDHIGAVNELERRFPGLPVYLGERDFPVLTHPFNQLAPEYPPIKRPEQLISAAELAGVEVIATPGHTPGGVSYYFPEDKLLLSGDTLFAGSYGRTDFPGGDMATLRTSLKKLYDLPEETLVIPGHGRFTTIGDEKAWMIGLI